MPSDLHWLARILGGDVVGRQVLCPGPGHSKIDRSLAVARAHNTPGGIIVHSYAGDDWRTCLEYVLSKLRACPEHRRFPVHMPGPDYPPRSWKDMEKTERALSLWAKAVAPHGTLVEAYLGSRGLGLPADAASVIRFHSACPFDRQHTPAMLCLVRNIATDKPQAIHRTALSSTGEKLTINGKTRLALGPTAGGAVKLTPDDEVTTCLGIGEGVESTLSLRLAREFGCSPVWSLLSADAVARFPVLAGIDCLWIAVDRDQAGLRAVTAVKDRWSNAGREVFSVKPLREQTDLNDLLRTRHEPRDLPRRTGHA